MQNIICNNCGFNNPGTSRFCSRCGHELPKPVAEIHSAPPPPQSPKSNMQKTSIAVSICIVVISSVIYSFFLRKSSSYDKAMMQVASEINKSCPIMVDKETRLDNTVAMPGNIFQYNYTLVNMDKASVDTLEMKSRLEQQVVNYVKSNPDMQLQREHKTTFYYYYKDKDRNYLFSILVTPDKYE